MQTWYNCSKRLALLGDAVVKLSIMSLLIPLVLASASASDAQNTMIKNIKIVSAVAAGGAVDNADALFDGKPETMMSFPWANGGASVVVDLGAAYTVSSVTVINGDKGRMFWLQEVSSGFPEETSPVDGGFVGSQYMKTWRPLLGRMVNLAMWNAKAETNIVIPEAVTRYLKLDFKSGGSIGEIAEVRIFGKPAYAERHLMCWSSNIKEDYLDKMNYLSKDITVTDVWLDYVETAFPQTNNNAGLKLFEDSGVLRQLSARGIKYWLAEHEAFTFMVSSPEDLQDDLKWQTTYRQAATIYARAKKLGFRGIVYDAEDYDGVSAEAAEQYKSINEPVDAWCFSEEFGYSGMYYQRGLKLGKIIKEVFGGPLMQVYEARNYAATDDHKAGNYWWLKGINDGGTEVWIATERTYGAGNNEIPVGLEHLGKWFVDLRMYVNAVYQSYPFATRVLPGFHPWNTRTRQPNYLPKYLDQQLEMAENIAPGYWIYTEGNAHAGDPRQVLDSSLLGKYSLTAEDYLDVFKKHRRPQPPKPKEIEPKDRG